MKLTPVSVLSLSCFYDLALLLWEVWLVRAILLQRLPTASRSSKIHKIFNRLVKRSLLCFSHSSRTICETSQRGFLFLGFGFFQIQQLITQCFPNASILIIDTAPVKKEWLLGAWFHAADQLTCPRIAAKGVRSSWEASATNCFPRADRLTLFFSVVYWKPTERISIGSSTIVNSPFGFVRFQQFLAPSLLISGPFPNAHKSIYRQRLQARIVSKKRWTQRDHRLIPHCPHHWWLFTIPIDFVSYNRYYHL